MYYVYILESLKDGKLYTGWTHDLEIWLKKHNAGLTKSTKFRRPFILKYYETYHNKTDAIKREFYLKSLKGGSLKKQLVDSAESFALEEIRSSYSTGEISKTE